MLQRILKHKKLVIIGCLVLGAFLAYYFLVFKKEDLGGVDADDRATAKAMVDAFKASQFAADLPWVMNEYQSKYKAGMPNQPNSGESWYLLNGGITASGAFLKTVWTGWMISYANHADKGDQVVAMPGVSVSDAKAAQALGVYLQQLWQDFRLREAAKF